MAFTYAPEATKDEVDYLENVLLSMPSDQFEMLVSAYGDQITEKDDKEAFDHLVDLRNECEWWRPEMDCQEILGFKLLAYNEMFKLKRLNSNSNA